MGFAREAIKTVVICPLLALACPLLALYLPLHALACPCMPAVEKDD